MNRNTYFRAVATAAAFTAVIFSLGACTSHAEQHTASPVASHSAAPAAQQSASALPLPVAVAGAAVLESISDTSGPQITKTISAKTGALWISVNCVGKGDLTVYFKPLGNFVVPCVASQISPTRNQINLIRNHRLSISVTADANIRWSMLIQE